MDLRKSRRSQNRITAADALVLTVCHETSSCGVGVTTQSDRTLCKSGELQDEIDLHIKRCDGLHTEKENNLKLDKDLESKNMQ